MLKDLVTIVIPVKEDPRIVKEFINWNQRLLTEFPLIVIDSKGGEQLKAYADWYFKGKMPFWQARKMAYKQVKTKFIFNLDSDVVPNRDYLLFAIHYLEDMDIGAVSTFFWNKPHMGKLEYGVSVWRTELLKELYDYNPNKMSRDHRLCECIYMWDRLESKGHKLRPSDLFAKHINKEGGERK